MKKLEDKVFYVLILIFTIFLFTILFIVNAQSYTREKTNIENNLMKMGNPLREGRKDKEFQFERENTEQPNTENIERRIFMDSVIYTVNFDENDNITEIITHTENGISNSEMNDLALKIINLENRKGRKIGNLYIDRYSYAFKENNQLIISDNEQASLRLKNELKTSLVMFVLLEIIIIYVSKKLTKWITKPANEALEKQKQFIQDASHELKTPIAVILASSEALEDDYQEKWINNIKSESERMNTLIMNLLDLSKLENIDDEKLYAINNVSKITQNSCLTFESLMFEKNINFQSNIEDNITLKCDPNQIKQLISIIVDNAIKHSEKEGEIIVNLKNQKNDIILEIINKGKPIPEDMREKIFERFTRVDESRNRADNRYGLGLAIAKRIVENHNGKISANSKDGYTTFKINFKKI